MELPVISPLETQYKLKTKNLSYKISPRYGEFNWLAWNECNSKCVLKNVDCEAKPGELTAIAGPSGAGKTTLLEIFAGMIVPFRVSGHVLVNDFPMDVAHFRRVSGYVTQDDALFPLLTVEETLTYSARLRLRTGCEKISTRFQKLLKELGLEHIAGARVGSESSRGISGGEKRRLSIGVDLVHDPAVLLLDEPTSGLDSASALLVMSLLKSMAKNQHKTIVLTIHQPGFRILYLLDKVILLSNGSVLHNGSLHLLEERLKSSGHVIPLHVNVLEYAIDVRESLLKDENDIDQCEMEQQSDHILTHAEGKYMLYCNSPFKEVLILSQRFSNNIFRTKQLFAAKTIQALLAGIVLGTIFVDAFGFSKIMKVQNQIGFFAFTLTFLMSSTVEALPIFLQERRILMRETSRGAYRVSSYFIANSLVFLPFLLIVALLYTSPVYWLVGLRRDIDGYLYFTLVFWMVVLMSNSFFACFSTLVPDFITGMSVIAGVMGSFFLFSGYFLSKDSIPKCWNFMQYLSLFKYPFECFMINEFGGEQVKFRCLESIEGVCFIYGNQFLIRQGLKESQKWSNLVMMFSFIIGYRFAGFLFLWYRSYRTRN
ncbi:Transporter, ABC superfamily (Breast cancer resistance protein) [Handroanthus impetiginosus]|uniref:Transporter, ABC superfamily (Breast cancer resistance protein) n=1 Tax=Handroanthus impetiginosus TaxID=429701 RepID=A0A2G9HSB9_9LAMI|nr:Transporter, ABC superfamily (Breast cancer resistance protein) [Handroanthus impetiginosus]